MSESTFSHVEAQISFCNVTNNTDYMVYINKSFVTLSHSVNLTGNVLNTHTDFVHNIALYCGILWLLASVTTTDKRKGSFSVSIPT